MNSNAASSSGLVRTNANLVFLEEEKAGKAAADPRRRVLDTRSGNELLVSPTVAEILLSFSVPRSIEGGARAVARRVTSESDLVRKMIENLVERRVLEPYEPLTTEARALGGAAGGLFGAPTLTFGEILAGEVADVVVLGMPYDAGTSNRPGARFAPDEIRRASTSLFTYRPKTTIWDPVTGGTILESVRLADAGNIAASVMRQNGKPFDALERATYAIGKKGALPVVLGGDHSCSLAVIRGTVAAHGKIGVIQFDAHDDYGGPPKGDWRTDLHHGNFMSWVAHDDNVSAIAQLGVRQLERVRPALPSKMKSWPGRSATTAKRAALLRSLPRGLPYHLTIDVDALDPSVMPSTGTPLPMGFRAEELIDLVTMFCRERSVVSIDIMELCPQQGREADALLVAEIVLRAIDAAVKGRRGRS